MRAGILPTKWFLLISRIMCYNWGTQLWGPSLGNEVALGAARAITGSFARVLLHPYVCQTGLSMCAKQGCLGIYTPYASLSQCLPSRPRQAHVHCHVHNINP